MASKQQEKRKELREQRLKADAAAKSGDRRQSMSKIIGIVAFIAVVGVGVVVVVSTGGSGDSGKSSTSINKLLADIPQNGITLGDPKAPVTLVEFGDLQCPACKQYSDQITPDVIEGPVKSGKANFQFENWIIIGPQSKDAAKAALAAGEQNHYWTFIENFYANQEGENSGYVTDGFLTGIAERAGVPDMDKWKADRASSKWDKVISDTDDTASKLGLTGTPSFAIRKGDGGLTVVGDPQSSDALIKAINDAQ